MIAISDSPPQYGVLALRDIVSGLVLLRGTLLCAGYGSPAGALLIGVHGVVSERITGRGVASPGGGTSRPDERNFISFVGGCLLCVRVEIGGLR